MRTNFQQIEFTEGTESNGGLESLLFILKYYRDKYFSHNLTHFKLNSCINPSHQDLEKIALKYGILAVVCLNIDINTLIEYNQPLIINISISNHLNHFVVCYNYTELNGFYIIDSINGNYYATKEGFQSMWCDEKCLAFGML